MDGDLQRRDAADGRPHDRRRLRRRRLPHRLGLRRRHARAAAATATTGSGSSSPSPSAPSRSRSRWASATRWPAGSTTTSRTKFAAIELVPQTGERRARDAARAPQRRRHGHRRDPRSPAWRRGCPIRSTGKSTVVQGLDTRARRRAADDSRGQRRPPGLGRDGRARHAAVPARGLVRRSCWLFRRDMPRSKLFLRLAACAGVAADRRDGGRLGGQRGRPPAVDRLQPDEGRGRRHRQHRGLG